MHAILDAFDTIVVDDPDNAVASGGRTGIMSVRYLFGP